MAIAKVAKVSPKSVKKGLRVPRANDKRTVLTQKERAELVEAATKLAIEMNRDALKELERY